MKKILITGARSYVGTALDNYIRTHFPSDYTVNTLDLRGSAWRELSFSDYDSIVHVAGIAHADCGRVSDEARAAYRHINTDLAIEVAEKAKADGAGQIIFMSSAIVYGDSSRVGCDKLITEKTEPAPKSFYGQSKLDAERGILPLADADFRVVILRCPMIYGRDCRGNYPTLSRIARKSPVFPRTLNRRSMLYVDNLSELVRLLIENRESGIFHPQDGTHYSTSALVREIAGLHGRRILLVGGMTPLLRLLARLTDKVNKAFGSLAYDPAISEYKENYRIVSSADALARTETGDNKR